jgi:hypothetical protein
VVGDLDGDRASLRSLLPRRWSLLHEIFVQHIRVADQPKVSDALHLEQGIRTLEASQSTTTFVLLRVLKDPAAATTPCLTRPGIVVDQQLSTA